MGHQVRPATLAELTAKVTAKAKEALETLIQALERV
jgi:hypothetical protein